MSLECAIHDDTIGCRARFITRLAKSGADILDALRLRHQVFSREWSRSAREAAGEIDHDRFDFYCDHLVVREVITNRLVGTYRILGGRNARLAGGFYSELEFDLGQIGALRDRIVEVGRACVHPDFRDCTVISALWAGLFRYVLASDYEYIIGCASIPLGDGGKAASSVCRELMRDCLSPQQWRAVPRRPFRLGEFPAEGKAPVPPLIKGYQRLGAWVCGAPSWDPTFNIADVLIMLPMARLNRRYAMRFMRQY